MGIFIGSKLTTSKLTNGLIDSCKWSVSLSLDPSSLFEVHSFPYLTTSVSHFQNYAPSKLTNGLLDSNLPDLLCSSSGQEYSLWRRFFAHKVTMMVRQGVVFVSTRPTQSDAKEYKMNHTLNVWVQRVGCNLGGCTLHYV